MSDHGCETCSDKDCAGQSEEEKALLANLARLGGLGFLASRPPQANSKPVTATPCT